MKTKDLGLPGPATKFLESEGYEELYPPQADSVEAGLLDGKSLLVSAPTASGKTLIAMMAMLGHIARGGGKIIYLSPLKALASEKFLEFKKLEKAGLGRKVRAAISTGDFGGDEKGLAQADILSLTNEKMDSLIRRNTEWVDDIGLVIADEVHLIGDEGRGPTLEMVLTQLKRLDPAPQIVGLSATITNSDELASWLGCKLVENGWRPVPLTEGVCDGGEVVMDDGRTFPVDSSMRGTAIDLGLQCVAEGGQSLVFAETRARSKSLAAKAADAVQRMLDGRDKKSLAAAAKKILAENEQTELVKVLAQLVRAGVAFHHAGLSPACRSVVEQEFRSGSVKLLASTPTLAAGVNLPARRVVISSIRRYNAKVGANMPISVLEYKQLCGRAGRPQYDDYGEAIIVAGQDPEGLVENYVEGEPEPIESKITEDRSLRTFVLSVIVTNPGIKKDGILEFFTQTLGGQQSRKATLKFAIDISLRFLSSQELLVKKGERYAATKFGQQASMLYVDPLTAVQLRDAAKGATQGGEHTLGILHLVTNCEEFFPKFSMRNRDYAAASELLSECADELLAPVSEYDCSRSLLALHAWISEATELSMSDSLGIESGDTHRMAETANWLLYCFREISKQAGGPDMLGELDALRGRVRYGIRPELLDLVRVRGIGRVRARALYKHGVRTLGDLRGVPATKLAGIGKIGAVRAKNIKSELARMR